MAKIEINKTEFEQRLTHEFSKLAAQYAQDQQLEEAVKDLQPQLGRPEALAEDLKQQVKLLRRDYREIAEVLRGV